MEESLRQSLLVTPAQSTDPEEVKAFFIRMGATGEKGLMDTCWQAMAQNAAGRVARLLCFKRCYI